MAELTYTAETPHNEYDAMKIEIEANSIRIEVQDGYEGKRNSYINMNHHDFDMLERAIKKFREAAFIIGFQVE